MADIPYSQVPKDKLILRDLLAAERTVLANERTYLAYIRTSLAGFVAGVSLIKFFESVVLEVVGWIFIPLAIFAFIIGSRRYIEVNVKIRQATEPPRAD